MIKLDSQIRNIVSDLFPIVFVNKEGERIEVKSINFNDSGEIDNIVDNYGMSHTKDQFDVKSPALKVGGLGYVFPGTRVIYHKHEYVLLYGWHINVSNQCICSWYLGSLDSDEKPKTLYKWMVDEINVYQFV